MRMLPYVALATVAVLLVPVALVWWLRAAGVVTSDWICLALAMVLAVAVSGVGSACWTRREGCEGVVFSDLLLWGWIRRMRMEGQLANAAKLLGLMSRSAAPDADAASIERRGELLEALAAALDAQDPYTDGHSRRVARHAAMIARELHLGDDQVQRIRSAGAVHDVGKLRIPAALLTKPDQLTADEFQIVKGHATEGAAMVAALGDPELEAIVRHHHERWDGGGYPSGLHGANIPLGARVIAVADTFDAITSIRPYRAGARHKQALEVLEREAGSQLDPAVVRAFLRYYTGRKGSVMRAALAVIPQRLFGWMNGNMHAAGNVSFGELAASTGSVLTAGLAALGAATAVGVAHSHLQGPPGSPQVAALGMAPAAGATPGGTHTTPAGAAGLAAAGNGAGGPASSGLPPSGPGSAVGSQGGRLTAGQLHPGGAGGAGASSPATPPPGRNRPPAGPGGGSGGSGGGSSPGGSGAPGGAPSAPAPPGGSPGTVGPPPTGTGTPGASGTPAGGSSGEPTGTGTPDTPPPPGGDSSGGDTGPPAGNPGGDQGGPPSGPTTKDECKDGGYAQWGFRNQGQCIASVNRH
jgi:HD-GYP domain-containing protein (c-di-GMP phosphodiesterase class II)